MSTDIVDDSVKHVEGNMTRDLWKLSCWEMARAVRGVVCVCMCVCVCVCVCMCMCVN